MFRLRRFTCYGNLSGRNLDDVMGYQWRRESFSNAGKETIRPGRKKTDRVIGFESRRKVYLTPPDMTSDNRVSLFKQRGICFQRSMVQRLYSIPFIFSCRQWRLKQRGILMVVSGVFPTLFHIAWDINQDVSYGMDVSIRIFCQLLSSRRLS